MESPNGIGEIVSQWILGIGGGALALALMLKKFMRVQAEEGVGQSSAESKKSVIDLMREEVERMAKINSELAAELNKLQRENISLHSEIGQLRIELETLSGQLRMMQLKYAACGDCDGNPSLGVFDPKREQ